VADCPNTDKGGVGEKGVFCTPEGGKWGCGGQKGVVLHTGGGSEVARGRSWVGAQKKSGN